MAAARGVSGQDVVGIDALVNMTEDEVWLLRKNDLRRHFLTFQRHLRSLGLTAESGSHDATAGTELSISPRSHQDQSSPSRLLSLPPEIRRLILIYLLHPPCSSPIRGPHPRSLQSALALTRTMDPSILRVCRHLNVEATALLYGGQEVHVHVDYNVWSHRVNRSTLDVRPAVRDAVRSLHVHIFLGNEKRLARPGKKESDARLEVVRKGVRKLGKWLCGQPGRGEAGRGLQSLRISWQEPPQTYTWEQKKDVLDEFRALRPRKVEVGEINWGLKYPGKKFRFMKEYLHELGQVREGLERREGAVHVAIASSSSSSAVIP